jgi:hypothetical protein
MNKATLAVFSVFLGIGGVGLLCPCKTAVPEPTATAGYGSVAEASWIPTISVSLGMATGGIDDFPPDPAARHPRDECPYDNWITHGDGHKTRCPYCDPPWDGPTPPEPEPEPKETRCQCERPGYYCACEEKYGKCQCPRISGEKKETTSLQQPAGRKPSLLDVLFGRYRSNKECNT